jgi:hypothetical protein
MSIVPIKRMQDKWNLLHWHISIIQILPSHYQNGHLILRCTAEVGTFYADYTEAFLETTRKEPIPERGMYVYHLET